MKNVRNIKEVKVNQKKMYVEKGKILEIARKGKLYISNDMLKDQINEIMEKDSVKL